MLKQKLQNPTPLANTTREMNIYDPQGTINDEALHQITQRHADMLRDGLREKILLALHSNLKTSMLKCAFHVAAINLNMCFTIAIDYVPFDFLQIVENHQAFHLYVERMESLLRKN